MGTDGTMASGRSFPAKPALVLSDPNSRITGMPQLLADLFGMNIVILAVCII